MSRAVLSPTVDLATGREKNYVYLDPEKMLDKNGREFDFQWRDVNLYMPGVMVDFDESKGEAKLRLPGGEVVRVASDGLAKVHKQDMLGVQDILQLDNFSPQSLIHTIRARFHKVKWSESTCSLVMHQKHVP